MRTAPHRVRHSDPIQGPSGHKPRPGQLTFLTTDEEDRLDATEAIAIGRLNDDGAPIPEVPTPPARPKTWPEFLAWRRTKCPLRDLAVPAERAEEVCQSTLEFVGEVAEMGESINSGFPWSFPTGPYRDSLIGEAGDVFFCGAWAMDAWGDNPLYRMKDGPLSWLSGDALSQANNFREGVILLGDGKLAVDEVTATIGAFAASCVGQMSIHAGKTADAAKKLKYQGREPDADEQVVRVILALGQVIELLHVAGATVEDAIAAVVKKLNSRYPGGYIGGGGLRSGDGA